MSKPFCLLSGLTALVVAVAIYGSSPSVLPSSQAQIFPFHRPLPKRQMAAAWPSSR